MLEKKHPFNTATREGGMILATIRMKISPQKRGEALKIIKSIVEGNRILPGCLSCRIYEDIEEDNVIMYEEMWKSEDALEHHLRSDEYRRVLLALEMALQHPEVRFNRISSSSGFETIEKARTPTGRAKRP
jgi:quinol monooxygenase YgiN